MRLICERCAAVAVDYQERLLPPIRGRERLMKKSACGNPNSTYHPTFDHIRPLSAGGCDVLENIIICHRDTNEEKADHFPHWKANGARFHAVRVKGSRVEYEIIED